MQTSSLDRFPKKPCKFCDKTGHFPYVCRLNPKNKNRKINQIGKYGQKWIDTRAQWLRDNPPTIEGKYYMCYLNIHPWCPRKLLIEEVTLDHVVARTRDPSERFEQSNLRPACEFCNGKKGSRSLEEVKPSLLN